MNTSSIYTPFIKFNYKHNPRVLFEDKIDSYSRSCSTNKLAGELKELIEICY